MFQKNAVIVPARHARRFIQEYDVFLGMRQVLLLRPQTRGQPKPRRFVAEVFDGERCKVSTVIMSASQPLSVQK